MQTIDDHRAELRELNELTVARIDSRFAQVESRIEAAQHEMLAALSATREQLRVELKAVCGRHRADRTCEE